LQARLPQIYTFFKLAPVSGYLMSEPPQKKLRGILDDSIKAPDSLRLLWLWTLLGTLSFARPFWFYFMPQANGKMRDGSPIGADFSDFWTAARLALAGKTGDLYHFDVFWADMKSFLGPDTPYINFLYAPNVLPLIAVFGLLPYLWSYVAWVASGTAAYLGALRTNAFSFAGTPVLLLVALSPAALWNLWDGHNGAFTAALFLGGFYLSERKPLAAGVLFGLLTFKPHLGILIPVALLLRRNWRCIGAAAATAVALAGLSACVWGREPWAEWRAMMAQQSQLVTPTASSFYKLMPGPYADAAMVLKLSYPWLAWAPAALFALSAAVLAVRREGISAKSVLVLALATLIIMPYGLNYDMVAVSGALAIYLAAAAEVAVPLHAALGLLWALPFAIIELKYVKLPLSSAILIAALFGLSRGYFRRESIHNTKAL
jgi:hypothetical protein